MRNNNFLQTMDRYGVLDNDSNRISQMYFDEIVSEKTIRLKEETSLKYGWIYLSVNNGCNFELYYNDICLIKINGSKELLIPCVFEKIGELTIKGTSGGLRLYIYGTTTHIQDTTYLLPFSKYIVKDRGKMCLLSYSTKDDIKNNNLTLVQSIENCLDIREYDSSSNPKIMWLINNDGDVYLCIKEDENTNQYMVGSDITDARIVYDYGSVLIVYIKDDDVYYKSFSLSDYTFGIEISLELDYKYVPKSLSRIQLDAMSSCGYIGVNFDDGGMHVYKIQKSQILRLLSKRADFSKIIVNGANFVLVAMTDYKINIEGYSVSASGELETINDAITIYNVNDLIELDNCYLAFSNGVCTEVEYDGTN